MKKLQLLIPIAAGLLVALPEPTFAQSKQHFVGGHAPGTPYVSKVFDYETQTSYYNYDALAERDEEPLTPDEVRDYIKHYPEMLEEGKATKLKQLHPAVFAEEKAKHDKLRVTQAESKRLSMLKEKLLKDEKQRILLQRNDPDLYQKLFGGDGECLPGK